MRTIIDVVEKRIVELFKGINLDDEAAKPEDTRLTISWDRAEAYAIDDAARKRRSAIGLVDQGQKFGKKTSIATSKWGMAVEFFVRCDSNQDIKTVVNAARAEIWHFLVTRVEQDEVLSELIDDISPVMDDVDVDRLERRGEGVVVFEIDYRAQASDIRVPVQGW